MKTLLLFRHAKSSWKHPELADQERPLNGRGRRAAVLMGRFMHETRLHPNLVLTSTAQRARETLELLLQAAEFKLELRYDERLYMATPAVLMDTVAHLDSAKHRVMVVGHNPGLEDFLYELTGIRRKMPTAALAQILLDTEKWSEVPTRHDWKLERLVTPKSLVNE